MHITVPDYSPQPEACYKAKLRRWRPLFSPIRRLRALKGVRKLNRIWRLFRPNSRPVERTDESRNISSAPATPPMRAPAASDPRAQVRPADLPYAAAAAPPTIVDGDSFQIATNAINRGTPIVMILGGAGTGKTTFLRELQKDRGKQQVFLAPTGVAALNLGGQTTHSFFGIPPSDRQCR